MLDIRFHPECDLPELVEAAADYQRLWSMHRERIITQLRVVTGLEHAEGLINAIVFGGVSQTHPFCVRASYDEETKLGGLIHELSHRLLRGNRTRLGMPPYRPDHQRENHELIDLFLFDVWTGLFSEEFARRQVEVESRYQSFYREAWEATLTLDRPARAAKLRTLLGPSSDLG